MDNELYYNKYLFQQTGGSYLPISTYDQIAGDSGSDIKSKTAGEAIGNLGTTVKDSAVNIGATLMENSTKVAANLVNKAIDISSEAIGLDPKETVEKAKDKMVKKATHAKDVLAATLGDEEFQKAVKEGTKSVTDMTKKVVENAQPAVEEISEKVLETTEKVAGKVAQQGTLAVRGFASDAASAVPVVGPMIAIANTVDATISQGLPAVKDAVSAGSEIVSTAANTISDNTKAVDKGVNDKGGLKDVGKSVISIMDRISKTIKSNTPIVVKGIEDTVKDPSKLKAAAKAKYEEGRRVAAAAAAAAKTKMDKVKEKSKDLQKTAMKKGVDMAAEASGTKTLVKGARAVGISDKTIAKTAARMASTGGGKKTRKRKKRSRNKTRNKRKRRSKSVKRRRRTRKN